MKKRIKLFISGLVICSGLVLLGKKFFLAPDLIVDSGHKNRGYSTKVLTGRAWVVDGDSLEIGGKKIRLYGIDAPEAQQTCLNIDKQKYHCGRVSTLFLKRLVRRKTLMCRVKGQDIYKRFLSECRLEETGESINALMVLNGQAVAYHRSKSLYFKYEKKARADKKGLWQGRFQRPSLWRKDKKNRKI